MINWLANPARFMRLSAWALPWCAWAAVVVLAVGLYLSLVAAPPDYQQGESVRIMFIHVPAAWMALSVYMFIAVASAVALVWRHPLAEVGARAAAPIGAGERFGDPRADRQAIGADQDLPPGAVHGIHREGRAVFFRSEARGDRRARYDGRGRHDGHAGSEGKGEEGWRHAAREP
jgi:hypothetical protein